MKPAVVEFVSYDGSVKEALDAIGAAPVLAAQKKILVKPNLVEAIPPPVTTPPECVEAVITYIRAVSAAEIVVAEGCGAPGYDTGHAFEKLGYTAMAARLGIRLIDLNLEKCVLLKKPGCVVFPEYHLPEIARTHYIITVPTLKAHSFAIITGALKGMMGFAPPRIYQEGGHWKKSAFHARMHSAIVEMCRYRSPDLVVLDATIGLPEFHLGGRRCDPPVNKIVAGFDPLEVDRLHAQLLGFDWRKIPHLAQPV
jgi:uncharacterized protein (DUF362 family)